MIDLQVAFLATPLVAWTGAILSEMALVWPWSGSCGTPLPQRATSPSLRRPPRPCEP